MSARKPGPLFALLKISIAAGLLALVVSIVPWKDSMTLDFGNGEKPTAVPGAIQGDWKGDAIGFVVSEAFEPDRDAPPRLREVLSRSQPLALERGKGGALGQELAASVDWRPSLPRVFGELEPRGLVLAFGSILLAAACVVTRWWRLLALVECKTTWWNALRLTFLGLFFNIVVPGLTGGDVVKAVLAVRDHKTRRADALMSVVMDRIIGLLALAVLAAVVILALGDRFAEIRTPVLLFVAAGLLGGMVYSSPRLRERLGVERLIARLPMGGTIKKLDDAMLAYLRHPLELGIATALSLINHVLQIFAVISLGRAFGDWMPAANYFAVVPVANIASSLPIAPGGWGVGEAAFGFLFAMVGASATIGIAVSVTYRLCMMTLGLCGGLFLLLPGSRIKLSQIEELAAEPGA
jgi:uncharacterized membrane protein YbhN (UPF0104 family)